MLSTHIMQEVEAICDKVIIINKGKLVANSTTAQIQKESTNNLQIVDIEFNTSPNLEKLQSIKEIVNINHINNCEYVIEADNTKDIRKILFEFAVQNGLIILTMKQKENTLEEVFQQLTK